MANCLFLRNTFVLVFLLITKCFYAQVDVVEHCTNSIEAQDVQALLVISAESIVFERDEKVSTVDRSQLKLHLADFFDEHPVKSFNLRHQGSSAHGAMYMMASYLSEKGKDFMLKIKFLNDDGGLKISAIKFSPE